MTTTTTTTSSADRKDSLIESARDPELGEPAPRRGPGRPKGSQTRKPGRPAAPAAPRLSHKELAATLASGHEAGLLMTARAVRRTLPPELAKETARPLGETLAAAVMAGTEDAEPDAKLFWYIYAAVACCAVAGIFMLPREAAASAPESKP